MSKGDALGGSATFDAVTHPMSSRAASFAAFAGQSNQPQPATDHAPKTPTVSLDRLAPNPYNPRLTLSALEEMADSLTGKGIIQPLTVVTRSAFETAHPHHGEDLGAAEYIVVDGNRRLGGARLAGLDDAPIHIDDGLAQDADTLLETALTAAVQHEDLEPLDEAKALERLVEVHGSQRSVARALGKSSGWVTQRLALLKLTPELKQALEDRTLPVNVARTVGQLPEQQQQGAAEEALAQRAERKKAKQEPGAYPVSTRPAQTPKAASKKPADPSGETDDEDLAALAADLKRRLTPAQVDDLVGLLTG
ncbi:ParB/RepB/Spo0J family partition protein [Streptomyces sp. NPDC007025]|uniref:ParB/RepB/Spo0J family partition protein n=1 Tax=Streptomyces sp. NPDC007025 TaxID=3364771 RepID=UPI0036AFE225